LSSRKVKYRGRERSGSIDGGGEEEGIPRRWDTLKSGGYIGEMGEPDAAELEGLGVRLDWEEREKGGSEIRGAGYPPQRRHAKFSIIKGCGEVG